MAYGNYTKVEYIVKIKQIVAQSLCHVVSS